MVDVSLAHGMENFPIEELELGVRSYNCLKRVGIETIGDLVTKTENELASIPNFGKKSIEEVKETLGQHGLRLRGDNGGPRRSRRSDAAPAHRQEARPRLGAPQGALREPRRRADRARRIKTTVTKAKAVKPIAEQMITLGRRGDIHARRQAVAFLRSKDIVHKLFAEVGAALRASGPGGYSRIVGSGRARATRPRWSTSSSSTTPLVFKERSLGGPSDGGRARGSGRGAAPRPTSRGREAEPRGRGRASRRPRPRLPTEAEEPRGRGGSRSRGRGRAPRPSRRGRGRACSPSDADAEPLVAQAVAPSVALTATITAPASETRRARS